MITTNFWEYDGTLIINNYSLKAKLILLNNP